MDAVPGTRARGAPARRFRRLAAAVCLAVAPLALLPPPAAAASKQPIVKAVVRAKKVHKGDVFVVDMKGRRLKGASAVAFHIVYDPSLVVPVASGFSEGTVLASGGAETVFQAHAASTADRVVLGVARLGPEGSRKKKGLVCRLTFRAISEGSAALVFDQAQITDAAATRLPASFEPVSFEVLPARGGGP